MEKSIVTEVVSTLEAVKSYGQPGFWILLVSILILLVLVIAAVVYQRIVMKRFQTASKATQDNFETIAADLRKRALGGQGAGRGPEETRAGGEGTQATTTGAEEITKGAEGERQSHHHARSDRQASTQ